MAGSDHHRLLQDIARIQRGKQDSAHAFLRAYGLPDSPERRRITRRQTGLSEVSNASDFSLGLKRAPGNYRRAQIYSRTL